MKDLNYFTEDNNHIESTVISRNQSTTKTFMASVFSYMFLGLSITGVIAYFFASSGMVNEYLINKTTGGPNMLSYIVMLAPLALVFWMSLGFNKLKPTTMLILFITYAAINGVAFSTIFLAYEIGAIYSAFFSASAVFAVMAIVGYTTSTDLTKLGNILMIGLFVLIGVMIINWFIGSSQLDYIASIFGVIIFTGLTAYDVQKLKNIGAGVDMENASTRKLIIYGALSLYLDFVNLFLFLLRLFASRD